MKGPREDLLSGFKAWEGEPLGENWDHLGVGFRGKIRAPSTHVHIAGAWVMSSARMGAGILVPGVYVKQAMGIVGTGPRYHVVEGIVDADIAEEWGTYMVAAASRSQMDVEAS